MSIEITVGSDFEWAVKTFCNRFKKSGILTELKQREGFESPSQRRRREKAENIRRSKRRELATEKNREYLLIEKRKTQQDYGKQRREEAMRTMVLALPKESYEMM